MVGVAKWRACIPCKSQKRGCDQKSPSCGRCLRLGLDCTYREVPLTVVEYRPSAISNCVAPKAGTATASASPNATRALLSHTASQCEVEDAFWSCYLPQSPPNEHSSTAIFNATGGLHSLREIAVHDHAARVALRACAYVCIGRLNDDYTLVQRALRLYGYTVSHINKSMESVGGRDSVHVLACCAIATIFEMFRPEYERSSSQARDWQAHVDGICRLIEARGPEKHTSGFDFVFFGGARFLAARAAIMRRKAHLFSDEPWRTIPWNERPKGAQAQLFDLMLALPRLLQRQDVLLHQLSGSQTVGQVADKNSEDGRGLIEDCTEFAGNLRQWGQRASLICDVGSTKLFDAQMEMLPPLIASASYEVLLAANHYWATCLIHYSQTRMSLARLTLEYTCELPSLPDWMQPRRFAKAIQMSAQRFFDTEAGLWGPQHSSFPITAAMYYYAITDGIESPELDHLQCVYEENERGKLVYSFVKSEAASAVPGNSDRNMFDQTDIHRMASTWYGLIG